MTCSVSMLTERTDGLNPLVNQVSNLLEKAFKSEAHIDIIMEVSSVSPRVPPRAT